MAAAATSCGVGGGMGGAPAGGTGGGPPPPVAIAGTSAGGGTGRVLEDVDVDNVVTILLSFGSDSAGPAVMTACGVPRRPNIGSPRIRENNDGPRIIGVALPSVLLRSESDERLRFLRIGLMSDTELVDRLRFLVVGEGLPLLPILGVS
jgi:hypothetical protein